MNDQAPSDRLRAGLDVLRLELDGMQVQRLQDYLALLAKWNRAFNLTAVRDEGEMVVKHLLDSLAVYRWFAVERVLDVGSGAGLPGIPLAIARPDTDFVLLDSNGKKTRFMTQAVHALGLDNVDVVQARVESWRPPGGLYDVVTSRAFASLSDMLRLAAPLSKPGGKIVAMKGRLNAEEGAEAGFRLRTEPVSVPGLDAERHVIIAETL
ncbi:MAG TPA: 16S rRNA (guanine(527)-N(7))-methyltransferase RsmG [Chromatiaceae bacterium]|nr:16S rRNA (guanine(527)-N(7))-methyltransferase RsmG [Chromatiaceae bacterium]